MGLIDVVKHALPMKLADGKRHVWPTLASLVYLKDGKTPLADEDGKITADNALQLGGQDASKYALKTEVLAAYNLPVATSDTLGGVKSGEAVTVNSDGTMSVNQLNGKDAKYYLGARNLLDNSDFTNPVNQRGQTSYPSASSAGYTIDRWKKDAATSVDVSGGCLVLNANDNGFYQILSPDLLSRISGKECTMAIRVKANSEGAKIRIGVGAGGGYEQFDVPTDWTTIIRHYTYDYANYPTRNNVVLRAIGDVSLEWIALYEGTYTADNLPPYVPRENELAACLRYFRKLGPAPSEFMVLSGHVTSGGTTILVGLPFVLDMRVKPTLSASCSLQIRGIAGYATEATASSVLTDAVFTLMPTTDITDCRPMKRGLHFNHNDEVATPAYYSVNLDQANIQAEMTGRSRSAIFRLTYPADGPAYLIVNPNSDEGQGYIELDTLKKEIRGYNPIHRIYQGWGKPAGHSGHFIIKYNDEIADFGTYRQDTIFEGQTQIGQAKGIGLYIAFERKNSEKAIIIKAASSFTDIEGARKNLETEIPHWSFEQTRKELTDIWEKHLGRVEATSANDTLCRKLYGAIYRASCLPRAISDIDGRYPAFSKGTPILQAPEGTQHYDDFSMWDTYRALHPLVTLLTPTKSGEMMQSLVDKYKQGDWLPIFPCWNSYTAAMIGDHCTAAIGDAYVKGVHNFDIETAYEGMRKNAFETPEKFEDYANGMGRRALKSYLEYGYIPLEDPVKEAFHTREQSSRTLEYAYDDFVLSQVAKKLQKTEDYEILVSRSRNFKNVIDPQTGYANGRYADGHFYEENKTDNFAFYITAKSLAGT